MLHRDNIFLVLWNAIGAYVCTGSDWTEETPRGPFDSCSIKELCLSYYQSLLRELSEGDFLSIQFNRTH